jgi:hypothetical protein
MQFITLLDYLLLPIYIFLIYIIATFIRDKYYPIGHPWRQYFMSGLYVKLIGAFLIGLVYQYYYGGGDTAHYFYHSQIVGEALFNEPQKGFAILFHIPGPYDAEYYMYLSRMEWYFGMNMFMVIQIATVINFFTFFTFLPTSLIFASICYTGVWALFRTFARMYPQYLRQVAITMLFIPTSYMWGSGIFKDTLCIFALGWLTFSTFNILIKGKLSIESVILFLLSFYILFVVKKYILLAFLPSIALWIVFVYATKIKNKSIRFLIKPFLLVITLISFVLISNQFSEELEGYSIDKIAETAETTRSYVMGESDKVDGSSYDLGEIDPSLFGLVKVFPKALLNALYGPFLWQSKKIIIFFNAIEASIFLYVTIKILIVVGFKNIRKIVSEDPTLQFFLTFVIIFGFAVGLTSGNYGSLSRYRIPMMPFFGLSLCLIYYKSGKANYKYLFKPFKF